MGKVSVKALTPIKYAVEGEEAKLYEPGDSFEVLEADLKQLHEAGAVEVSEEVASQLEAEKEAEPVVSAGPTTVPADTPGVAVIEDGVPVVASEGTSNPLPEAPQQPSVPQPTEQEISETLDSLQ